jgi:hypothetical protein
MFIARDGAVRNAVVVLVEITSPASLERLQIFFPKYLASVEWFIGISNGYSSLIHSDIKS